jgi:hypothetical protein
MLAHGIIQPKSEGWMDDVDYAIEELGVGQLKGYTIGDRFSRPRSNRSGGSTTKTGLSVLRESHPCGHQHRLHNRGLMPAGLQTSWPGLWEYATVSDLGKAAKTGRHQLRHLSLGNETCSLKFLTARCKN